MNTVDMYDYIIESKDAVRSIVDRQDLIFRKAVECCLEKPLDTIYLVGSGTSYHAALAARTIMEKILHIKSIAMYPMQFKDQEWIISKNALVIGISHSGRSASTIKALNKATELGLMTLAMTAERGSPIEAHAEQMVYIEIGPEKVGPKTKGFIGSLATIILFGLNYGLLKGVITEREKQGLIDRMLQTTDNIPDIADKAWRWYKNNAVDLIKSRRMIITGYEANLAAMMEGTLKICEAVRYSVVGYEQEEFMHGIYHGINQDVYMIYLALPGQYYERCLNMKQYFETERKNHNYLITSDRSQDDGKNFVYDFVNDELFASMEYVVPLQVIARKLSLDLGIDCNISSDPNFHRKMGSYRYERE